MNTYISRFCCFILTCGLLMPSHSFAIIENETPEERKTRLENVLQKEKVSPTCMDTIFEPGQELTYSYQTGKGSDIKTVEGTLSQASDIQNISDINQFIAATNILVDYCYIKPYFLPQGHYSALTNTGQIIQDSNGEDIIIAPTHKLLRDNHMLPPFLCPQAHPEQFYLSTTDKSVYDKSRKDKTNTKNTLLLLNRKYINKLLSTQYPPRKDTDPTQFIRYPSLSDIAKTKHYSVCVQQREDYIQNALQDPNSQKTNPSLKDRVALADSILQDAEKAVEPLKEERKEFEKLRQTTIRATDKAKASQDGKYPIETYEKPTPAADTKLKRDKDEYSTEYWQNESAIIQELIVAKNKDINNTKVGDTTYRYAKWNAFYLHSLLATIRLEIQTLKTEILGIETSTINIDGISIGNENRLTIIDNLTDATNGDDQNPNLIESVTQFILQIVGTLGVLLIVIAGFMIVTSNGDQGQVDKGKNIIKATVIGLAIAFLSYIIVQFVISLLFKV